MRQRLATGRLGSTLTKNPFLRKVGMIAGGTALGQLLIVFASPLLTHLYEPEDYGLLAIFTSIVYVLMVVASLHFEAVIALPSNRQQGASVVCLALLSIVATNVVIVLALLFFGDTVVDLTNEQDLKRFIWLIPPTILAAGVFRVFVVWGLREQEFGHVARSRLIQSAFVVVPQAILGFAKAGPGGLLIGVGTGFAIGSVNLIRLAWANQKEVVRRLRPVEIIQAARQYRSFALLGAPAALFNSLGVSMPVFILATFYSPAVVGWFALAQLVIGRPLQFVAASVAQVYYSEAALATRQDTDDLFTVFLRVIRTMTLIAVPFVIAVIVLTPFVFTRIFGDEWAESVTYIRILAVMFLVEVVVSPTADTVDVVQRQDLMILGDAARLATMFAVAVSIWHFDPGATGAVMLLGAGGVLSNLISLSLSVYAIRAWRRSRRRQAPSEFGGPR